MGLTISSARHDVLKIFSTKYQSFDAAVPES
jgi:hypothetical protein